MEIVREGRVAAPVAGVWAVVSDAGRAPDWFSFAERTEVLSGSGLGERRRQHGRWGQRRSEVDQEVVGYEPERLLAWKHLDERVDGEPAPKYAASTVFRIELEPAGDGATVVRLRCRQEPATPLKGIALRLFGSKGITRRMEESLVRLTRAVD